jgi:antitoxin component YwqK of YwqJK toxin-antitoxin module
MRNKDCDSIPEGKIKEKRFEIIDGFLIKYHANNVTVWSKGKMIDGHSHGYWQWFRIDGSLKRSGYFEMGVPVGEWTTYDGNGKPYKITNRDIKK